MADVAFSWLFLPLHPALPTYTHHNPIVLNLTLKVAILLRDIIVIAFKPFRCRHTQAFSQKVLWRLQLFDNIYQIFTTVKMLIYVLVFYILPVYQKVTLISFIC